MKVAEHEILDYHRVELQRVMFTYYFIGVSCV
jgi:hypothetical protein